MICCNGCGRRRRLGFSDGNTELPRPGPLVRTAAHLRSLPIQEFKPGSGTEMPPSDTRGLQKRINPENRRGQDVWVSDREGGIRVRAPLDYIPDLETFALDPGRYVGFIRSRRQPMLGTEKLCSGMQYLMIATTTYRGLKEAGLITESTVR